VKSCGNRAKFECQQLMVLAHQDSSNVCSRGILGPGRTGTDHGKPIRLQTEALYTVDQYDVVLM